MLDDSEKIIDLFGFFVFNVVFPADIYLFRRIFIDRLVNDTPHS